MSIPRILVVDDQLATDSDLRSDFLADTNCIELAFDAEEPQSAGDPEKRLLAAMNFCRGQTVSSGVVQNSLVEIKKAVKKRWNGDDPWSLVLQDVMFVSGSLDRGLPAGRERDDKFGEQVRDELQRDFPGLPVVMLTSKHQNELESQGAPYLSKTGISSHELAKVLVRHGQLTKEQKRAILRIPEDVAIASSAMFDVFFKAFSCAPTDANVLLLGETGVGKEVIARYIRDLSRRAAGLLLTINVAAISGTLIESELFGHVKGAFSGATEKRIGAFERASGGTLFLDEIGDMASTMQDKILRALENREIQRVGSNETIKVDIRLISATHQNLEEKVSQGEFREDLLYRIKVVSIPIPPLRDRPEDIVPIAEAYLDKFQREMGRRGIVLSDEAKACLQGYGFLGNVRELKNIIEGVVIQKGNYTVVGADDLPSHLCKQFARPRKPTEPLDLVPKVSPHGSLTLSNLADALRAMPIDASDPALQGALARLGNAHQDLLKRLAGAALQSTKDRRTGGFNRTEAMGHLKGEPDLTPTAAKRELNEILGRNRTAELSDEDIRALVEFWEAGSK